ncbi:Integrin alpha-PS2 [Nymphon striatum]|nr:Integrin alpha-PS2 [Nymphon striatum]
MRQVIEVKCSPRTQQKKMSNCCTTIVFLIPGYKSSGNLMIERFSTAVGEFTNDNVDDVVVGRPRGSNLTGEVIVFDFQLKKLQNFSGEQIGSYFGYSVAVADINGDKLDDIIVGAPFYNDFDAKDDSYESGRVIILYQNKNGFSRDNIDGKHSKGRFGLSLSSLGDINKDGHDDVVIGAPYEGDDGQGTVYIFQGSRNGIVKKPSQVIYAKDISGRLRTFGFSVSGGVDIDANGYNDLLVGGYSSDTAVYFRARPIITITSEISISPKVIHLEDKLCFLRDKTPVSCLTITVCFNSSGSSSYNNVYGSYEMILDEKSDDSRLFFVDFERETKINVPIQFDKKKLLCDKKNVYVTNSIYDKLSPIVVKVQPSLTSNRRGKRQASFLPPIIDQTVESTVRKEINIDKKCGTDQICIPDLQMKVTHNLKKYEYSSKGRQKKISFTVELVNKGENAYDSRFFFNMSDLVYFDKVNGSTCQIPFGDNTLMECLLGNPFERLEKVKIEITMTPKEITRKASDFEFTFSVNSSNPERNSTTEDNDYVITIPVQVDVNLNVNGFSYPQIITYNVSTYNKIKEKVYESDLGPEIVHAFQITNLGESNIRKAEFIILWPSTTLSGKPILYITRPPITSKNVVCRRIVVDPLQLKLQPVRSRLEKITFPSVLKEIQRDEGSKNHRTRREVELFNETAYENERECDNARCIVIHCTITNLQDSDNNDREALIAVAGRLWVSTVTESINATIKKNNLPLFKFTGKKEKNKVKQQNETLKTNLDLFSRLFIVMQQREADMDVFFKHENNPTPPALSDGGKLRSGTKSDLMNCLVDTVAEPSTLFDVKVLDGAAVVHMLSVNAVGTFIEYANSVFLPHVVKQLENCQRIDVVWDTYLPNSIKESTREKRGKGVRRKVLGKNKIPGNWNAFLCDPTNKQELFSFLSDIITTAELPSGKVVAITCGEKVEMNGRVHLMETCDHEEADTRILIHLQDALQHGATTCLVRTVDTDVIVILISKFYYFLTICPSAEIGLHSELGRTSGCDTVSSFYGRGKKTAWQAWKAYKEVTEAFVYIASNPFEMLDVTSRHFEQLERYCIILYDKTSSLTSVNDTRKELFCKRNKTMENLPPTQDALINHTKRALYQAGIWTSSQKPMQHVPSPADWGWTMDADGKRWVPVWRTLDVASKACKELLDLSKVGVQSKIIARVLELPYQVDPAYLGYEYTKISTEIDSIEEPPVRRPIPWWIIAVALCVGIIILIVLIVALWKCGFFQRKKFVEKSGKREKNGYHPTQSDDAYL